VCNLGLHFIINGKEGAQDGEELSQGDFTNPLLFDGFYPAAGVTLYKGKTIFLRADEGEEYYLVQVEIRGANARKFYVANGVGSNYGMDYYGSSVNDSINYGGIYYYRDGLLLGKVGDTNTPIKILALVNGNEDDSPDLTTKIYARSCYNGAS